MTLANAMERLRIIQGLALMDGSQGAAAISTVLAELERLEASDDAHRKLNESIAKQHSAAERRVSVLIETVRLQEVALLAARPAVRMLASGMADWTCGPAGKAALEVVESALTVRTTNEVPTRSELVGPDLDLLRKLASGEGGRRTGDLIRRGLILVEITEAGRAALGDGS